MAESGNSANIEALVKTARGRPRIKPVQDVKNPRGRPRKHPPAPPSQKKEGFCKYAGNEKEYFKKYYQEKVRQPCACETCGKQFACSTSITRHVSNNKNCRIKRLEEELARLKTATGPVEDFTCNSPP